MKLFSIFAQALDQYTPTPRQIILAFSGGMDSRVMLDLLAIYRDIHPQHHYLVIHVHHGLSHNADKWLNQCQEWVYELDFAFKSIKVFVDQDGKSIEQSARQARYKAIEDLADDNALVLTAHHADDQAETFLLALKRGSGVTGLAAMPEIRKLGKTDLLRPLLSVYRYEIESYAEQQGLSWIDDESNFDCRFDRNFIRQEWMPMAQTRWPGIVKNINRCASLCAEQEALIDELLCEHDKKITDVENALIIGVLLTYSEKMQVALLRRWLKKNAGISISAVQIQQVFKSMINASEDANPIMELLDFQLRRYQQKLYLLPCLMDVSGWQSELNINQILNLPNGIGSLELKSFDGNKGLALKAPNQDEKIYVSFDPQGISAHPLGRQGKRKLKKLFQEYGVPSWQRKRTPLIFYGDKLAAVADLFVCKGFEGQDLELIWSKP